MSSDILEKKFEHYDSYLEHYGTPRHSGRYPWGSGDNPYQHHMDWLSEYNTYKDAGMKPIDIAKAMGYKSTGELRAKHSVATNAVKKAELEEITRLQAKGLNTSEIAREMGIGESSVRSKLKSKRSQEGDRVTETANFLKDRLKEAKYLDISLGTEFELGISKTKLGTAIAQLEDEGYVTYNVQIDQLGTEYGKKTTLTVLAPKGTEYKDIKENIQDIKPIKDYYSEDGGATYRKIEPPQSIDSKRVYIRYAEDGGTDKDGLIELRPGVEDISLGQARYVQARIAVDGEYYMKGMACYGDVPKGYDIVYNSNKKRGTAKEDVFKKMDISNPENPFGATIKPGDSLKRAQRHYIGKDGKEHLSAINIVNEEGDWYNWKDKIAPQMLSKQMPEVAKKQLNLTYALKEDEYNDILKLTNPTIKKQMLDSFADDCDASSVHLKAVGFAGQKAHVILPFPSIKETEVYAPNYENGEQVALVRFPHAGTFEIPLLRVNNRNPEAKKAIGAATDAIGINHKTASQLSGADFDGDTVLVIPTKNVKIRASAPIPDLVDFDTKIYSLPKSVTSKEPEYLDILDIKDPAVRRQKMSEFKKQNPDFEPRIPSQTKQTEMGKVSNLITDMTIQNAPIEDVIKAVKHSMVVIDSEKHYLNWKQSEKDNDIPMLKQRYQGSKNGGASTLISLAKSEWHVPDRKEIKYLSKDMTPEQVEAFKEGKKLYKETGKMVWAKDPKTDEWYQKPKYTETTKMAEKENAFDLSSGTVIENIYASYANKMKNLANQARKESRAIGGVKQDKEAKVIYKKEVQSLKNKLALAMKSKPLERQAQILANVNFKKMLENNPHMSKADKKKFKGRLLTQARNKLGAKRVQIEITDREWEAIQKHAVAETTLNQILLNTDSDALKQRAMPRETTKISSSKLMVARARLEAGYTQAEVAKELNISTATLMRNLNEQQS